MTKTKTMTDAQRAYETKRAAKAGMSLDKHLAIKAREQQAVERAKAPPPKPEAPKKPGFFGRILEKLQKPI